MSSAAGRHVLSTVTRFHRALSSRFPAETRIRAANSFQTQQSFSSYDTWKSHSNDDDDDDDDAPKKTALVLGSSGSLGRAVAHHLSTNCNLQVIGADLVVPADLDDENPAHGLNHGFVQVAGGLGEMTSSLLNGLSEILSEDSKLDVVVCAAGGWKADPEMPLPNATQEEVMDCVTQYADSIEQMLQVNLHPSLAANFAVNRHMGSDGLFVIMGATAALNGTPGMMGYGVSKVAAHHVAYTTGEMTLKSATSKGKRKATQKLRRHAAYLDTLSVVGVLPTTLDTPINRKAMPYGKFNTWVLPEDIASEIGSWIETPSLRPHSGALIKVVKDKKGAAFRLVR